MAQSSIDQLIEKYDRLYNNSRFTQLVDAIISNTINADSKSSRDRECALEIADKILYDKAIQQELNKTIENLCLDKNSPADLFYAWRITEYRNDLATSATRELFYRFERSLAHLKGRRKRNRQEHLLSVIIHYAGIIKHSDLSSEKKDRNVSDFINGMIRILPKITKFGDGNLYFFMNYSSGYLYEKLATEEIGNKLLRIYNKIINYASKLSLSERKTYFSGLRNTARGYNFRHGHTFSELDSRVVALQSNI